MTLFRRRQHPDSAELARVRHDLEQAQQSCSNLRKQFILMKASRDLWHDEAMRMAAERANGKMAG